MSILREFSLHYKDPSYDRIHNPLQRSIAELLPVAVSWVADNQIVRVDFTENGIVCPLTDASGVAIVENPFRKELNKAYVVNLDGRERFVLIKPSNFESDVVFTDVYYVDGILSFFLSDRCGDRRVECDAANGGILRITQAR